MTTSSGSNDNESSHVLDMSESPDPGPLNDPGPEDTLTIQERLEAIAVTIQNYALLRFDARALVSSRGDIVDAIAAGVNYLGEELEASYSEIERKVADRTAELDVITKELAHRTLHDELTGSGTACPTA